MRPGPHLPIKANPPRGGDWVGLRNSSGAECATGSGTKFKLSHQRYSSSRPAARRRDVTHSLGRHPESSAPASGQEQYVLDSRGTRFGARRRSRVAHRGADHLAAAREGDSNPAGSQGGPPCELRSENGPGYPTGWSPSPRDILRRTGRSPLEDPVTTADASQPW
jgi:hypothetical protein